MTSSRPSKLSRVASVVLFAGAGCATAIVEDEPDDTGTSASSAATGGTTVAASGGGTTSSLGGSASPAGGTTSTPSSGGSGNLSAAGRGGRSAGAGAGGSGTITTCPTPRMPAQPGEAQGNSGSFDTAEAVCYFVEGSFNTWNCSNLAGRTVTVNGMPSMCGGSLPAKIDGGYYFEFGAAMDGTTYTSFYWYTS